MTKSGSFDKNINQSFIHYQKQSVEQARELEKLKESSTQIGLSSTFEKEKPSEKDQTDKEQVGSELQLKEDQA